MADKEPRRRRRRKDIPKKDDNSHLDSHVTHNMAVPSRDSDQDVEEEPLVPAPSHEPSKFAQVVFVILFAILVAAMGTVFIALHGTQRDLGDNGLEILEPVHIESEPVAFVEEHIENNAEMEDDILEILPQNFEVTESYDDFPESPEPSTHAIDDEEISEVEPEVVDSLFESVEEIPMTRLEETFTDLGEDVVTIDPVTSSIPDEDEVEEDDMPEPVQITETPVVQDHVEDVSSSPMEQSVFTTEDISSPSMEQSVFTKEDLSSTPTEQSVFSTEGGTVDIEETPSVETSTANTPLDDALHEGDDIPDQTDNVLNEADNVLDQDDEDNDDNEEEEEEDLGYGSYEKADITNLADFGIREELDTIEKTLEKSPEKALHAYEDLLKRHPSSPRSLFGKAKALDQLAETKRSNKVLEEAIATYQIVLETDSVPSKLYLMAGLRCVERMTFRGLVGKSLKLLLQMSFKHPDNMELKNKIAVGYLLIGQNRKAEEAFNEVIAKDPNNGFAKVHLGFILKTDHSNYAAAIPLLSQGIASKEDGVIDGRFFFHLGDALARVGKPDEALKVYEEGVKESLFLSVYQRSLYNVQGLTGRPWWEPEHHKYYRYFEMLEKNWQAIKAEALALTGKSQFTPESENLQDKGEWEQYELFVRGKKIVKNCASVPVTCNLIEQMPDAATCKRGQAKFSIMQPGTHVWAHTGPTNCRLRAHLGLIVPDGVKIRVANETRKWEEGKVLLFDDSFEHEVWHEGTGPRLVLIVDFWHPELTPQQRASLSPI